MRRLPWTTRAAAAIDETPRMPACLSCLGNARLRLAPAMDYYLLLRLGHIAGFVVLGGAIHTIAVEYREFGDERHARSPRPSRQPAHLWPSSARRMLRTAPSRSRSPPPRNSSHRSRRPG